MQHSEISRATLGRIPSYLEYLRRLPPNTVYISATAIAKGLRFGEVQARKDLASVCGLGRPKVGYRVTELITCLERFLGHENGETVIVGAGKLGRALLDYGGFKDYGLTILAAFDELVSEAETSAAGKPILPMSEFKDFCASHGVKIGIIAVTAESAQEVCNLLCESGIRAIWSFAPRELSVPSDTVIQYENLALSLAHLKTLID